MQQTSLEVKEFALSLINQFKPENQPLGFWIFDTKGAEKAVERWKKNMPTVRPCFAVKCNPEPHLVKLLGNLGCGFDCASLNEIKEVLDLGFSPEDITYSQTFKPYNQLIEASHLGIRHTIVDSIDEVQKIAKYAPEMGVMIRIMENDTSAGHVFGEKFGLHDNEVEIVLKEIKDKGLNLDGVHFHVGSDSHNSQIFTKALTKARNVVTLAEQFGMKPYLIDIGGGFSQIAPFEEFATTIEKTIKELEFPEGTRFIAEPGRYLASNVFHLVCSLHGKRVRIHNEKKQIEYTSGDGLHGSFGCCIWFEKQKICECVTQIINENTKMYESIIYGPSCNGSDKVAIQDLPEMEPGKDWLLFPNMGAYTISMATNFNGFEERNHIIYTLPSQTTKTIEIPKSIECNSVPSLNGILHYA
ncbi:ornithine decarboxylase, putative [Entamoeba dispar SAW760]|uniref:ornithine decarboxylase n=1 Tax=Entamoeba dispar (strain ATCC PRA-260 / SAW760) TaxID=370354 RepID=B0EDN3_ENTDS|nr:ornithine decarboxylase, putative [Entamoeba dispar SAW760]EDR27353.1 ornithine decarboxylase, putative [Entamoeba dispar SAW760]|eukprot:EDR27353.1 ornithine decarboxylase, putative [Entamoeba dispar SAW760]